MAAFIDAHRASYGVESICRQLPIAPSTYCQHKCCERDPAQCSIRRQRDQRLLPEIERVWNENHQVYGAEKVWRQLKRERFEVARCTVERLMNRLGLQGVIRGGKKQYTTVADPDLQRPADLVKRQFTATRPNQLWIADFTYVAT